MWVAARASGDCLAFRVGGTKSISLEVRLEGMVDKNILNDKKIN